MPETKRRNERLVVLLVIGVLALNYPLLAIFSKARLFFGVPVLYLYLFSFWAFFIFCLAMLLERKPRSRTTPPSQPVRPE